jgi:hypothetical protein
MERRTGRKVFLVLALVIAVAVAAAALVARELRARPRLRLQAGVPGLHFQGWLDRGRVIAFASELEEGKPELVEFWSLEGDPALIERRVLGEREAICAFAEERPIYMTAERGAFVLRKVGSVAVVASLSFDGEEPPQHALSPAADLLAQKIPDGNIAVRAFATGAVVQTLDLSHLRFDPNSFSFSPGGDFIDGYLGDDEHATWSVRDGKLRGDLEGHDVFVLGHGETLFYDGARGDGDYVIVSTETREVLRKVHVREDSIGYSPALDRGVCVLRDASALAIYSLDTGKILARLATAGTRSCIGRDGYQCGASFSPEGERVATSYPDGVVEVWDVP